MSKILKARDVAQRLNVSAPTAYEIMARADFPSFRPTERTVRTTEEALEEWINKQMYAKMAQMVTTKAN